MSGARERLTIVSLASTRFPRLFTRVAGTSLAPLPVMPAHPDRVRKNYGDAKWAPSKDTRPAAGRREADDHGHSNKTDEPRPPRRERERAKPR